MSKGQAGPSMVRKIFERDKGICVYCGAPAQEVDHVIPVMDGGRPISSNLVCVGIATVPRTIRYSGTNSG